MNLRRTTAVTFGVAALVIAGTGVADADTVVQVRVPTGSHSLYIYQGPGPEGAANWLRCFALNGSSGVKTPDIPAHPGQSQWNFFAYADSGCPIDEGPLGAARNQTAPRNPGNWQVTLR